MMQTLITKLEQRHKASEDELTTLLNLPDSQLPILTEAAHRVRLYAVGKAVHLRAIIEFSNHCRCRCRYCGLNCGNHSLTRFRLTDKALFTAAEQAYAAGYRTFVLQSGEDAAFTRDHVSNLITHLKMNYPEAAITLSLGERATEEYREWFDTGAARYLIKHETGNAALYSQLHEGDALSDRLAAAQQLMKIGYQTGGGILIGLPGQTIKMIAADLLLLKRMAFAMVSIGPFISHPQTPLAAAARASIPLTIKAMALARLLMPTALIPATSALLSLTNSPTAALRAGANVLMQKAEAAEAERLYTIYPKKYDDKTIVQRRTAAEALIREAGFTIGKGQGNYNEQL